jgi:hypothetical protein
MTGSVPTGCTLVTANRNRPMVAADSSGRIFISDTALAALLLTFGIRPEDDVPFQVGDRGWWAYTQDVAPVVLRIQRKYYAPINGRLNPIARARKTAECARAFMQIAKCGAGRNTEMERE